MALVTELPRFLPLALFRKRRIPKNLSDFLNSVPAASLGALLFPGILFAIPEKPVAGWLGFIAAILLSWFGGGLTLAVIASILVAVIVIAQ
jgi:branched-subunit amino acid transport protein